MKKEERKKERKWGEFGNEEFGRERVGVRNSERGGRERVHAGIFEGKIEIAREIKRGNRRERKEDAAEVRDESEERERRMRRK